MRRVVGSRTGIMKVSFAISKQLAGSGAEVLGTPPVDRVRPEAFTGVLGAPGALEPARSARSREYYVAIDFENRLCPCL